MCFSLIKIMRPSQYLILEYKLFTEAILIVNDKIFLNIEIANKRTANLDR